MYIRALGLLLFLTRILLAQEPTPILPDANMTPGDAFDVTAQDICTYGYARKVRNVPAEMKREVYREYGIISHGPGDYEIDHLIPLELGKLKTGSKTSFMSWFAAGNSTSRQHDRRSLQIGSKRIKNTLARIRPFRSRRRAVCRRLQIKPAKSG